MGVLVVELRIHNAQTFAVTPSLAPLKHVFSLGSPASELPSVSGGTKAITDSINFSKGSCGAGLFGFTGAARGRSGNRPESLVSLSSGMQANTPNNNTQLRTLPIISCPIYRRGTKCLPRRTGSTVLELSFQRCKTVVPAFSGLPSHGQSRARLLICSHVAGSRQPGARSVLRKMK